MTREVPGEDHNCVALWDAWVDPVNTETDSPVPGWESSFMIMGTEAHTGSKMEIWGRGEQASIHNFLFDFFLTSQDVAEQRSQRWTLNLIEL